MLSAKIHTLPKTQTEGNLIPSDEGSKISFLQLPRFEPKT